MTWPWLVFGAIVIVMLALDLGVFNRDAHVVSAKEAGLWTALWIGLGISFTGVVYVLYEHGIGDQMLGASTEHQSGAQAATDYLTAYLLEKSLSVDNIFVIALVFQRFGVAPKYRHRVLFWGILGAVLMRAMMLLGGLWLLHKFTWLFYIFGAYLIYTGLSLLKDEEEEVPDNQFLRRLFRVAPQGVPHDGHFLTRVDGKLMLSSLGFALVTIEWTDVVFALDSIPAVLAVSPDPFIVYTSNIFAILGLRSLYFVLDNAVEKFSELRYALSAILVFIGLKLLAHNFITGDDAIFHLPHWVSLTFIVVCLTIAITVSLRRQRAEAAMASETGASETSDIEAAAERTPSHDDDS